MGMDVIGNNATAPEGEYFRNNVWWWRPLADYCMAVAPELTAACGYWHSNDGDGLDEEDSLELANVLQAEIDSGRCAEYAKTYAERLATIPRETCGLCGGTGIRTDAIGVDMKQPEKVIDEPGHPRHGQTGWCNGCNGVGTCLSWDAAYPFSVENVQEFAVFLRHCGGFRIY